MMRMNVTRIFPFLYFFLLFTSCTSKYKVEGSSSVTSLDGKMLYLKTLKGGQWVLEWILRRLFTDFLP